MSIRGRRDPLSDGWSWEASSGPNMPLRPRFLALALWGTLAIGAVAALVTLIVLSSDDGSDASGANDTPTPSAATRTASPEPTESAQPQNSPRATLSPTPSRSPGPTTPAPEVHLFAWSRAEGRWIEKELQAGAGYREGEALPLLLRIVHAAPNGPYETTVFYEVVVRYQCASGNVAGFDFLASPGEQDSTVALTSPGPGRLPPDSAVSVPKNPELPFTGAPYGSVQLWGGTFQRAAEGPLPEMACEREKEVHLGVGANEDTLFLVLAAHLASAGDWGAGEGFSSADGPLSVEVTVIGAGAARVEVAPGAAAP